MNINENDLPDVRLVADHLENTSNSLVVTLKHLGIDTKWVCSNRFGTALDELVIFCTECHYWYEPSMIQDHPETDEFICYECLENEKSLE